MIWEKDGFFSGSNYYYVLALSGFYTYHETYEQRYIKIGKNNVVREQKIRDKFKQELLAPDGEIGILETANKNQEAIIKQQKDEIARLTAEVENIERPVEDAVREIATDVMKQQFASIFAEVLTHTSQVLTLDVANDTQDDANGTYGKINDALHNLLVTAMLNRFCEGSKGINLTPTEYATLRGKVDKDVLATVIAYVTNMNAAVDPKSNLLKLFQNQK